MQDRACTGRPSLFTWLELFFSERAEYVVVSLSSSWSLVKVLIVLTLVLIAGFAYSILSERIDRKVLLLINVSSNTLAQLYFYSICTTINPSLQQHLKPILSENCRFLLRHLHRPPHMGY